MSSAIELLRDEHAAIVRALAVLAEIDRHLAAGDPVDPHDGRAPALGQTARTPVARFRQLRKPGHGHRAAPGLARPAAQASGPLPCVRASHSKDVLAVRQSRYNRKFN